METNFRERYASLSDEELLHIAGDRRDLLEEAAVALDAEMAQRGLTHEQAQAKKRDELRLEIEEARAHHPKRNKSKYFVAQVNLRVYLVGLTGLVLLMFLTLPSLRDEWAEPILFVYVGAFIACSAVRPWVRRTLSFWLSLAVGSIPQFVVTRWLTVYHPAHSRGAFKGSGFLSIFTGWIVGSGVFLLLEKLHPTQEAEAGQ